MTGRLRRPTTALTLVELDERLKDLERRTGERPTALRTPEPLSSSSSPRTATVVVAGAFSTDDEKAGADYICDGTDDDVEIQAAIDYVKFTSPWGGGSVHLCSGSFDCSAAILLRAAVDVGGSGSGTLVYNFTNTDSVFKISGDRASLHDVNIDLNGTFSVEWVFGSNFRMDRVYTGGRVMVGFAMSVANSLIGRLEFAHASAVVGGGTVIWDTVKFRAGTKRNRLTGCVLSSAINAATSGFGIELDGDDNTIDNTTFLGYGVGAIITVLGNRNSFVNNRVGGVDFGVSQQADYAVEIDASAVGARVKFNDLRPGVGIAWNTAPTLDNGTGSIVSDNDT